MYQSKPALLAKCHGYLEEIGSLNYNTTKNNQKNYPDLKNNHPSVRPYNENTNVVYPNSLKIKGVYQGVKTL